MESASKELIVLKNANIGVIECVKDHLTVFPPDNYSFIPAVIGGNERVLISKDDISNFTYIDPDKGLNLDHSKIKFLDKLSRTAGNLSQQLVDYDNDIYKKAFSVNIVKSQADYEDYKKNNPDRNIDNNVLVIDSLRNERVHIENENALLLNQSDVIADGKCYITAYDNSRVLGKDNSQINAHDKSEVSASQDSRVFAFDNSAVRANGGSLVTCFNSSKCAAFDNSKVNSHGNSTAVLYHDAKAVGFDNSLIFIADRPASAVLKDFSLCLNKNRSPVIKKDFAAVISNNSYNNFENNIAKLARSTRFKDKPEAAAKLLLNNMSEANYNRFYNEALAPVNLYSQSEREQHTVDHCAGIAKKVYESVNEAQTKIKPKKERNSSFER